MRLIVVAELVPEVSYFCNRAFRKRIAVAIRIKCLDDKHKKAGVAHANPAPLFNKPFLRQYRLERT